MTYTVTIGARAEVTTTGNANKSFTKLPDVTFGSSSKPVYPYQLSTRIAAGQNEVINLSSFGFTRVRALIVKSTRPVTVTLSNADDDFVLPLNTYMLHVLNTAEAAFTPIQTVTIAVGGAPTPAPSPAPAFFPAALVEVFVVAEET